MRIGILSDVHGNVAGLQRTLEVLQQKGCERLIFLGDAVGYFPYAKEVCHLLTRAEAYCLMCCMTNPEALGESFNIGNAHSVQTIYGLASTVIRVLGSRSSIHFEPAKSADIELRIPSVTKARAVLGFEAAVNIEQGILRTAEFYRE